ncbi:YwqJ-related putative deaminase [Chryseobacterium sp. RU33C]|uniref:YwqJ-related putative deaminase n=1 Tax=Chryseobacterium sp. RU33C TaxID=1907398 RepID=UPI000954DB23|nr:YwqJ-related putative deaminase [Chryseobacterium sp. RU33C]SIQ27178.1 YwqJ-like deaminase [Chryseobacterium sp. RU33C]
MENFDDEFGDLSGYKILSFDEVTQGFEGNKNPLQGLAGNSFEELSAFKNSPFGQYWEKNIHEWAKNIFGASKIIEKRNLTIADISKRVSYSQADAYGAFSDTSKYNFVVYAHPDGEEVIKMYEDPNKIPDPQRPFEVLVFIETDDGKFDFGKIVRVKFGSAVIDDLKDKYFRELPWNDNDPKDIAEEFIKRAWKASVSAQTVQAVEQEQSTPDFKDLMIKAIQYEYDNHKFDDFSWFMLIIKGGEYLDFNLPNWAFGIGHWLRTKKYKEDKYWNGDLPEKEYTPAFLPNSFFYDKQEDRVKSLKESFHKPYDALKSEINKKITHDDPVSKVVKKWINQNIDECQKITDGYLEGLAKIYIPDGSLQTIIKHYHAFYVGLYNGILEFLALLCDLVAIIILILRDEIGFRMTDKLTEKFENFVIALFYNTFELLDKICKKFYRIVLDFGKWYLTYEGKSYFLLKELGELVPDIIMFLIPVLKGSKAAKIGAVVEKEAVEEAVEETIEKTVKETAEELTEQEAKHISQSAKEALETGKTKEATEQAVKEAEQKVEEKAPVYEEIEEIKVKGKRTPKEQKVFLKKIDMNFLLRQYADEALTKWKDPFTRPGAVGVLEGEINGKVYQTVSYSSKGIARSKIIGRRHKLVQEWLTEIADPAIKSRRNHGMCAEPVCISEFLFEAEKQLGMKANSMKIEQAREILSKTKSRALRIDNLKEPLVQGLPKKACASCNPMLHYFKIKEIH